MTGKINGLAARIKREHPTVLSGRRAKKPIHDGSQKNELNGYITLNVKNISKIITANVTLKGNDHGIILTQGGKFGGWALYMDNGKPAYTYNYFGLERYTITSPTKLTKENAEIKLDFVYDGNGTGNGD
jgi:arylsulfatase